MQIVIVGDLSGVFWGTPGGILKVFEGFSKLFGGLVDQIGYTYSLGFSRIFLVFSADLLRLLTGFCSILFLPCALRC